MFLRCPARLKNTRIYRSGFLTEVSQTLCCFESSVHDLLILVHLMMFQAKFRATTGKPLLNRRKLKERYSFLVVGSILVTLYTLIHIVSPPKFRLDFGNILAHTYGNILAICATYMWVGLSWGIHDAAKATKLEFRRVSCGTKITTSEILYIPNTYIFPTAAAFCDTF